MNSHTLHTLLTVAIVSGVTILLRAFAFIAFPNGKRIPAVIEKLGNTLPYAIMSFLVIYCLKDIAPTVYPHGIPDLISVLFVAVLQIWRRNSTLSVLAGTALYMILIQFVF